MSNKPIWHVDCRGWARSLFTTNSATAKTTYEYRKHARYPSADSGRRTPSLHSRTNLVLLRFGSRSVSRSGASRQASRDSARPAEEPWQSPSLIGESEEAQDNPVANPADSDRPGPGPKPGQPVYRSRSPHPEDPPIVVDEKGAPVEVILPWAAFCEVAEILGLDLDAEAEADLRETRRDFEAGSDDAFVPLPSR